MKQLILTLIVATSMGCGTQIDRAIRKIEAGLVGFDVALDRVGPILEATCKDPAPGEHEKACDRLVRTLELVVAGQEQAAALLPVMKELSKAVCDTAGKDVEGCDD